MKMSRVKELAKKSDSDKMSKGKEGTQTLGQMMQRTKGI
jgi:hypothetical protein